MYPKSKHRVEVVTRRSNPINYQLEIKFHMNECLNVHFFGIILKSISFLGDEENKLNGCLGKVLMTF